jgi:hypothetical protein
MLAMFHVFNASLSGRDDKECVTYGSPNEYLLCCGKGNNDRRIINNGICWRITVERTWRAKGVDVTEKRDVNPNDTKNIKIALKDGWVITFPQGTTKSFKPVRKVLHILWSTAQLLFL